MTARSVDRAAARASHRRHRLTWLERVLRFRVDVCLVCACGHAREWHTHLTHETHCSYTPFGVRPAPLTAHCACPAWRPRRIRIVRS